MEASSSCPITIINTKTCDSIRCMKQCQKVCPVMRMGNKCITFDDAQVAHIDTSTCVNCGLCVTACPENAIHTQN